MNVTGSSVTARKTFSQFSLFEVLAKQKFCVSQFPCPRRWQPKARECLNSTSTLEKLPNHTIPKVKEQAPIHQNAN